MLLSAVSVLVVAQSSSEIPEGLMNNSVLARRPDIALRDKKQKTCLLNDIALSDDSNLNTEETEKKLNKYKDMEIDIGKKWKLRTKIVSYNGRIRNNEGGIRSEPSVALRSPVGHTATDGHTN